MLEAGVIRFCDEHKIDMVLSTCVTCRLVSRTVRGPVLPELIKLFKGSHRRRQHLLQSFLLLLKGLPQEWMEASYFDIV